MTARYLLGIDIGTTALKAVLLDPERGVVVQAGQPHTLRSPRPGCSAWMNKAIASDSIAVLYREHAHAGGHAQSNEYY